MTLRMGFILSGYFDFLFIFIVIIAMTLELTAKEVPSLITNLIIGVAIVALPIIRAFVFICVKKDDTRAFSIKIYVAVRIITLAAALGLSGWRSTLYEASTLPRSVSLTVLVSLIDLFFDYVLISYILRIGD